MKKIATIISSALATGMLALTPMTAFAADSPSMSSVNGSATASDGSATSLNIQYTGKSGAFTVEQTSTTAANIPSGTSPLVSFKVTESTPGVVTDGNGNIPGGLLMTFSVGEKWAGYNYTIYVDHDYGTDETKTGTVSSNGTITINVDRLSVFSVVMGDKATTATSANKSATSPKTGYDMSGIAIVSIICLAGAGICITRARNEE